MIIYMKSKAEIQFISIKNLELRVDSEQKYPLFNLIYTMIQ